MLAVSTVTGSWSRPSSGSRLVGTVALGLPIACALGCASSNAQRVTGVPERNGGHRVFGVPDTADFAPGSISFDCDTPAGRSSMWSQAIGDSGSVTGTVYIAEVRRAPNWPPGVLVALTGTNIQTKAGVEIALAERATSLRATLYVRPGPTGPETPLLHASHLPISGATFALRWAPGHLQARFDPDAQWTEVPLPFRPERLYLVCSSSEAVFHSVKIAGPQPEGTNANGAPSQEVPVPSAP